MKLKRDSSISLSKTFKFSRQFISIKEFELETFDEYEFIDHLLISFDYIDNLIRVGSEVPYDIQIAHGPYQLGYISKDSFLKSNKSQIIGEVIAWIKRAGSPPAELSLYLESEIFSIILASNSSYAMKDIEDSNAFHYYGEGMAELGFHEYLLFDKRRSVATLLSLSDD